ncbi:hypothetical protein KC365_g43 [Hortaea werneckii]|nr:hypothetical protein KC365_g43 [Hortaea werneckii]
MRIVSDEALEDQRPEGVARAYRTCMEEEDEREGSEDEDDGWGDRIEPGLTTSMCLFVDGECIRSVVEETAGSTPFVKAVDATLGMGQRHEYTGARRWDMEEHRAVGCGARGEEDPGDECLRWHMTFFGILLESVLELHQHPNAAKRKQNQRTAFRSPRIVVGRNVNDTTPVVPLSTDGETF